MEGPAFVGEFLKLPAGDVPLGTMEYQIGGRNST